MTPEADPGHRQGRIRARQACLHCNRRRIRCNVLEKRPCENCVAMNVPCEVGVSKRGKYPRKKNNSKTHRPTTPRSASHPISPPVLTDSTVSSASRTEESLLTESNVSSTSLQAKHWLPHGLVNGPRAPWISPGDSTCVFLGESSPLTCVIDEGRRSPHKGSSNVMQKTRLHYPIPERLETNSARVEELRAHKAKLETQLQADGAFSYPPTETLETLLRAYFTWFHPCFPILDRTTVQQSYAEGNISPLLLQAMLFIGVSLCTDAEFARTGFEIRYRAKFLFYSRAKAIYDAGWESNKTVKLQSLFLLSYWRGGPSEEQDTRFWLGVAISLAQKRGMHMMSKLSFGSPREEKLWKRIWWALYIRDQQSASALGLPARIRDEDCDVVMLDTSDIREDEIVENPDVFGTQNVEDVPYPVEMARLARILRTIVSTQYLPIQASVDTSLRQELQQQLSEWESNIPSVLKLGNTASPRAIFLTGLLHTTHNYLYVLLYRSLFLHPSNSAMDELGQIALNAATKTTRIIEDMLSHNLVQHGVTHLITHSFSALCIHTIHCRRTTGTARKLAEHRARLCLLGLQELQKTWDLENWVLDLFFRCLDDCTARTLRLTDNVNPTAHSQATKTHENGEGEDHNQQGPCIPNNTMTPNTHDPTLAPDLQTSPYVPAEDLAAPTDWYGLFNFTDDFADVLGTPQSQESLNVQNLQFLYRFL
ncbi:Zn(II)2Cys6 transcription factor [Aspergillus steynii IBT 23096]|uniref:Zn(II)2Cys6 transcription factor n=1 Tax=Aspergillus steynii IBT 23096 TaxID=1392250 RepID=A0A2I2G081_9EURO|nr:Zn(II)2Cys6 transcription factor [Aspergillus steynii IBT 23096]PLB46236.1 Zn(II)2Cys6 transcription factor [Aspergillus steynii IBT 23096]